MPAADALQLYHPMTLQSMPHSPGGHGHHHHHHHHGDYPGGGSRHMLNVSSARSAGHQDYSHSRQMGLYVPTHSTSGGGSGHSQSSGYAGSDVPLSAPATLSGNPFSSNSQSSGSSAYPSLLPSPRSSGGGQQQYFNDGPSHSGSASGSTYGTPQ